MRALFLVDLHGRAPVIPAGVDLVLLGGDITHFGRGDPLPQLPCPVWGVAGNCDLPGLREALRERDLERFGLTCEGVWFGGLGAGLPFGNTPYERSEAEFEQCCAELEARRPQGMPWIFVCHQPPYGTACDRARRAGHVGSRAVRSYVEQSQPLLLLCGHIHESKGEDTLGSTRVLNPGPAAHGHGLLFDLNEGQVDTLRLF